MRGNTTKKTYHPHIRVRRSVCLDHVSFTIRSLLYPKNLARITHHRSCSHWYNHCLSLMEKQSQMVRRAKDET